MVNRKRGVERPRVTPWLSMVPPSGRKPLIRSSKPELYVLVPRFKIPKLFKADGAYFVGGCGRNGAPEAQTFACRSPLGLAPLGAKSARQVSKLPAQLS